jgi:hypothetical protein
VVLALRAVRLAASARAFPAVPLAKCGGHFEWNAIFQLALIGTI